MAGPYRRACSRATSRPRRAKLRAWDSNPVERVAAGCARPCSLLSVALAHVRQAIARDTPRGWRLDKLKSRDNIDAVVALGGGRRERREPDAGHAAARVAMKRCLGGCGHLIAKGIYCARCRPRNRSTRAWRQTQAMVLYRDAYRCQLCDRAAVEVDHIVPVLDGGTDDPANLRPLCHECHASRCFRASVVLDCEHPVGLPPQQRHYTAPQRKRPSPATASRRPR